MLYRMTFYSIKRQFYCIEYCLHCVERRLCNVFRYMNIKLLLLFSQSDFTLKYKCLESLHLLLPKNWALFVNHKWYCLHNFWLLSLIVSNNIIIFSLFYYYCDSSKKTIVSESLCDVIICCSNSILSCNSHLLWFVYPPY